ncbi:hypothetical protein K1F50_20745 [Muricauda oceani]|uniref:Uncharacterized protein n=1 Tax=Flagellimonas oceani TaxID=2698672 RepID=A0A6G7J5X1_9FLAO|nr:hypothetical protein [Allomuricauda oceani]MBW8245243.1 hypothetical protein [Allomuricauda oceani]QII46196.1 hypothetical protein GVT53_16420 [Allomuricauda oceani]
MGEGKFGGPGTDGILKATTITGKNADCPEENTLLPINEEDEKIINNLTGKAKCVYDKLKSSNGNLFNETIGAFIDDPEYNLTLKTGNCITTNDACTNPGDLNNIVITLEDVNQSPIGIAALILHEAIHAELYRYVSRFKSGEDPNNRARLFQLYKFYKEQELGIGNIQHVYMTENYINPIAVSLRSLDGNKYPLDYYKSFAWDGLREWDANNLLSMEMNNDYYSYRNTVINNSNLDCN